MNKKIIITITIATALPLYGMQLPSHMQVLAAHAFSRDLRSNTTPSTVIPTALLLWSPNTTSNYTVNPAPEGLTPDTVPSNSCTALAHTQEPGQPVLPAQPQKPNNKNQIMLELEKFKKLADIPDREPEKEGYCKRCCKKITLYAYLCACCPFIACGACFCEPTKDTDTEEEHYMYGDEVND